MSEKLLKEKQSDTEKEKLTNSNNTDNSEIRAETQIEQAIEIENSEQMAKAIVRVMEQHFSGPIPPPNVIKGYESVLPGSADRIIKMAEQQSAHRQQIERMEVEVEARDSFLGVIFAFLLGIGCLIACIVTVINVPAAAGAICGSILGVTGIGSIVTAFLQNTRRANK